MSSRLVLASASPRRAELLARLGLEFEVRPVDLGREPVDPLDPAAGARRAALAKARAAGAADGELVLAADTIVVAGGRILGKPADRAEAAAMLRALSAGWHEVLTGVAVRRPADGGEWSTVERTRVRFRELAAIEIEAYVAGGEPLDKAGAYAIQGQAAVFIERVEGCCSNVVGLPLAAACRLLREAGFPVLGIPPASE